MHFRRVGIAGALVLGGLTAAAPAAGAGSSPVFAALVEGNNHSGHLVVGRLGGSGHTILTRPDPMITELAVSPSGARIAFVTGYDPDEQLEVIDADGSNEQVLAHAQGVNYRGIVWSADERTLYYGRYRMDGSGVPGVWSIAADGSSAGSPISGGGEASAASLRPGGKWLALNSYRHAGRTSRCAVMRAHGGDRRTVGPHDCMLPRWRPGRSQVAASLITANGIEGHVTIQLWVLSTANSQRHDVPHTQSASTYGRAIPLAWSDDGQFIYYQHFIGNSDDFRVFRIRPDGSGKTDVTPALPNGADSFAVQPAA